MNARSTILGVVFASLLAIAGDASAQSSPTRPTPTRPSTTTAQPMSDKVEVEVLCVRATNANSQIDSRLSGMAQQLRYTRYTGFRLADEHAAKLSPGQSSSFEIEGNRRVDVQLLDRNATEARLRVQMYSPQGTRQLDTTVSIRRDRSFMVAGPKIGQDVLILPVTVRY